MNCRLDEVLGRFEAPLGNLPTVLLAGEHLRVGLADLRLFVQLAFLCRVVGLLYRVVNGLDVFLKLQKEIVVARSGRSD